jgi:hypothetical protein
MANRPVGAVIEIVEKRRRPLGDSVGDDCIVPNEIRINGQALLSSDSHPVQVHNIELGVDDLVLVTLTLVAKRIMVGAEGPEEVGTDG